MEFQNIFILQPMRKRKFQFLTDVALVIVFSFYSYQFFCFDNKPSDFYAIQYAVPAVDKPSDSIFNMHNIPKFTIQYSLNDLKKRKPVFFALTNDTTKDNSKISAVGKEVDRINIFKDSTVVIIVSITIFLKYKLFIDLLTIASFHKRSSYFEDNNNFYIYYIPPFIRKIKEEIQMIDL